MSDEIKVGATVNSKYELMSVLGKGHKATVYKGYQHFAKKSVALKIIDSPSAGYAGELRRFQQESKTLATLHAHKGIVNVLDFGAAGVGQAFIVMELIEGQSLRELLDQKSKLDVDTTEQIFHQVIDALSFVHENKIVHAGLNPTEIMLTPMDKGGYCATVIDFGSAVVISQTRMENKLEREPEPSEYASPEQISGATVDQRADIYSIGSMMYEALVGHLPESNPPTFSTDLGIPEVLQAVIVKALSEAPEKRFSSMKEMNAAFHHGAVSTEKKDLWGWTKGIFK